jgi:hypothetical protein
MNPNHPDTKCPHCGNTDGGHYEDNGCNPQSADFTLLCLAPVDAGEESNPDANDGICGCQFEPNDADYTPEEDEDEGIQRATSGQLKALGREWE